MEEKMINLSEDEKQIYKKLLDKYKGEPSDQRRVKFEVETNGMKPSELEKFSFLLQHILLTNLCPTEYASHPLIYHF